ncbi:sensor histidine kinase [Kineococcus rubinsiae]|uniref:sensor histidine kinase n=1 Tax=Kineococcus rubinsiae TaxID=2609562 RepID=UPI0027E3C942|nr:sensor histidine kinase [Kineococcus rubinsiae]
MPQETLVDRTSAWFRDHVLLVDSALAAVITLVGLYQAGAYGVAATFCALLLCAPLALRRVQPALSGVVVAVGGLLQLQQVNTALLADVAVLFSLYALAAYAPRWASLGGLVLALIGSALVALRYYSLEGFVVLAIVALFSAVTSLASWALGSFQRVRRQYVEQLAERARLLEVERENESRLAVTGERQRIAREMHDVVAHSLSVIIAQADGGRYAARTDPAVGVDALETISATGRQALTDMRSLLGVLRTGPGDERTPQPDVSRIPDLVQGVRASGLDVTVDVAGTPRPLPPAVQLAAYRIVQESLTNVLKHAGPAASAHVEVRWDADALRLAVDDDGRGASALVPAAPGGQGLLGMSERARLHGGSVTAAPRPGGGFRVAATLPCPR